MESMMSLMVARAIRVDSAGWAVVHAVESVTAIASTKSREPFTAVSIGAVPPWRDRHDHLDSFDSRRRAGRTCVGRGDCFAIGTIAYSRAGTTRRRVRTWRTARPGPRRAARAGARSAACRLADRGRDSGGYGA